MFVCSYLYLYCDSDSLLIRSPNLSCRYIKTSFSLFPQTVFLPVSPNALWTRVSSPLRENVKDCFLFVNVRRGHAEVGSGTLNALSPFGPVSTRCTWPPLTDNAMERSKLLRLSAPVEEKGNKRCFIRLRPKRGSTYCQENFLIPRDEFKEDQSQGWRRTSDCCYQNTFPHPEKREIKDGRREEEQTSLPLAE